MRCHYRQCVLSFRDHWHLVALVNLLTLASSAMMSHLTAFNLCSEKFEVLGNFTLWRLQKSKVSLLSSMKVPRTGGFKGEWLILRLAT